MEKAELIEQLTAIYGQVQALADDLTPEQMAMEPAPGVWTIKDTIAHLAFWDRNFANLIKTALKLEPREVLSGTLDEINARAYTAHHNDPAEKVMDDLAHALQGLIKAIETFSDEQLNTPGLFEVGEGKPLGQYIVDEVRGHFATHMVDLERLKAQAVEV